VGVPQRIVDLLEVIQVDEKQRERQLGAMRQFDRLTQPVVEQAAVG
jgi:hypothetical protein